MDTSAARRNIMARIRAAQRRPAQVTAAEQAAADDYLRRHLTGPLPELLGDVVEGFAEQARAMASTVAFVDALTDVPAAVADYLRAQGLPMRAMGWHTLSALPWADAGCAVAFRAPCEGDAVGVTGCFCAVAETGTLALLSGEHTHVSAGLLPETHIAVVAASRIVHTLEHAFALMRSERGGVPRAVNFISGPSRTGDIEQTIVLGAHGPYRVHAIIVRHI
jgi:L-lactate dehydrogenase complex protein LldG